jgi:hypothetical protein
MTAEHARGSRLLELVRARLSRPAAPALAAVADHVRKLHEPGVAAVLAYGSCLRGDDPAQTLIDLYVLTYRTSSVSRNPLSRLACRALPPNVYYGETAHAGRKLRAKVAVLTLDSFERGVSATTRETYFWARFAQPSLLLHVSCAAVAQRVEQAVAAAVTTMVDAALALSEPDDEVDGIWIRGLQASYATEFRPESSDRARSIVAADRQWYRDVLHAAVGPAWRTSAAQAARREARRRWAQRRRTGKLRAAARLIKASFTFRGGADYVAWKIARHSGEAFELHPWQRRHPVFAAAILLPRLLRKGAVR